MPCTAKLTEMSQNQMLPCTQTVKEYESKGETVSYKLHQLSVRWMDQIPCTFG